MRFVLWLFAAAAMGAPPSSPLVFETNQGQAGSTVRYLARSSQAAFGFHDTGIAASVDGRPIHWTFPGAQTHAGWQPDLPGSLRVNSFIGPPSRWRRNVPTHQRLRWQGLYPGVDLLAYARRQNLEFDFIVHPGGDPRRIRLHFDAPLQLARDGSLLVAGLRQLRPVTYQQLADGTRKPVDSRFRLINAHEAAFEIGTYDRHQDLVIDPVVQAISYYGGDGDDEILGADGALVCGSSAAIDFLIGLNLPNANQVPGARDVFLIFDDQLFYFGGAGDDRPTAFANLDGGILVAGTTTSPDFPVTAPRTKENQDAFLVFMPLSSNVGSWLGRYWGEPGDRITAIAARDWPLTPAALASRSGTENRIVLVNGNLDEQASRPFHHPIQRLWADNSELIVAGTTARDDAYLTSFSLPALAPGNSITFGGTGGDELRALAVDAATISIGGQTNSPDLPLKDPWQDRLAGAQDGFIATFERSTFQLRRSSYHGGSGDDVVTALLPGSPLLAAGTTASTNLPASANDGQTRFSGGLTDGFFVAVPLPGEPLHDAGYLGGPGDDEVVGITATTPPRIIGTTTAPLDSSLLPRRSYRGARDGFSATLNLAAQAPIILGRGLLTALNHPAILNRLIVPATLRSSDPSRFLLRANLQAESQPVLIADYGVYLHGLADSGDAELIIDAPGLPPQRLPVRLVPGGFAIRPTSANFTPGAVQNNAIFSAAFHPDTGQLLAEQTLAFSPNQTAPALQLESSDPAVVEVRGTNEYRAVALGSASLRITGAPELFRTVPLPVTVTKPRFQFTCPSLGEGLRTYSQIPFSGYFRANVVATVDESSPVRMAWNETIPQTYLSIVQNSASSNRFWFDTTAGSGIAKIELTADAVETATFACPVVPSRLVFTQPSLTFTVGDEITTSISPQLTGVLNRGPLYLSPALAGQTVAVSASGAAVDVAPLKISAGATSLALKVTAREEGRFRLTLPSGSTLEGLALPAAPFRLPGPIRVGQWLSGTYYLSSLPAGISINLRASPGKFLLRGENQTTAQEQLAVKVAFGTASFSIDALGESGSTDVSLAWETATGKGQFNLPVEIVDSTIGLLANSIPDLTLDSGQNPVSLNLAGTFHLNGQPVQGGPSPALFEHVRLKIEPAGLAEIVRREDNLQSGIFQPLAIQPTAPGLAEVTLETTLPVTPGRSKLRLRILPVKLSFAPVIVGANLIAAASIFFDSQGPAPTRLRLTSSNPAVLRLSHNQASVGQDSIEISSLAYFVHGISAGTSVITAEAEGIAPFRLDATVLPTAVVFNTPRAIKSELIGGDSQLLVSLVPLDSTRRFPIVTRSSDLLAQTLRPGLESLSVDVSSDPAGIVEVTGTPLRFNPGTQSIVLTVRHKAPGLATVILVPPPGFSSPANGADRATFELAPPQLIFEAPPSVGRDTLSVLRLRTSSGEVTRAVTITSSDPSRLLLSISSAATGTPQITMDPRSFNSAIYLHGLSNSGSVTLTAESSSLLTASTVVTLSTATPVFVSYPRTLSVTQSGSARIGLMINNQTIDIRPGANVVVNLRATPAGILQLPAQTPLGSSFALNAIAPGSARLEGDSPDGFPPLAATEPIVVSLATFSTSSNLRVGKDLLAPVYLQAGSGNASPATLTSLNPDLLLLGASATMPGQASLVMDGSQSGPVYLHGLASRGTATFTVAAPGYAMATFLVELVPSGFQISAPTGTQQLAAGATLRITLTSAALDPATMSASVSQSLRPGISAVPTFVNSNAAVLKVARITGLIYEVTALNPGRARLSVAQPAGFTTSPSNQSVDFEVNDAFFGFEPPRLAQNLRIAASVSLTPAPSGGTVPIRIVSRHPDLLAVAGSPLAPGAAEVTINASRESGTFYLDGMAASGAATLAVSAPGYRPFEIELTLQPAGFIFKDTSVVTLPPGSPWRTAVQAVPISNITRQPFIDNREYSLRPGLPPVTLDFTVTGNTGLRLTPLALDPQVNWLPSATWTSPGPATVTIVQPAGFGTPARGNTLTVSLQ